MHGVAQGSDLPDGDETLTDGDSGYQGIGKWPDADKAKIKMMGLFAGLESAGAVTPTTASTTNAAGLKKPQ